MKTREQRISEGWVERWGLYDWEEREWQCETGWTRAPEPTRCRYASRDEARANWTAFICNGIGPRRFWTRKRPKPAPELKVGDEVLVKGTIVGFGIGQPGNRLIRVQCGSDTWICDKQDIVRAPKEK